MRTLTATMMELTRMSRAGLLGAALGLALALAFGADAVAQNWPSGQAERLRVAGILDNPGIPYQVSERARHWPALQGATSASLSNSESTRNWKLAAFQRASQDRAGLERPERATSAVAYRHLPSPTPKVGPIAGK